MTLEEFLPSIVNVESYPSKIPSAEAFYGSLEDRSHSVFLRTGVSVPGHRMSVCAFNPFLILRAEGRKIRVFGEKILEVEDDPFDAVKKIIGFYSKSGMPPGLPFTPGGAGAFSYDLNKILEDLPSSRAGTSGCPDLHFSFFRDYLVCDIAAGKLFSIKLRLDRESEPRGLIRDEPPARRGPAGNLRSDFDKKSYCEAVRSVKERIRKGEIYQANISQQFSAEFSGDSYRVFDDISRINPAPMSAYLDCGDFRLISSSPERFLMRKGAYAETRPIKGTRPRGRNPSEDASMRRELQSSAKDSAELAMIIDLSRNDLGKNALPGTVRVINPRLIEEYANVFHTLGIVSCLLDDRIDSLDFIRGCFPGGSVTGCPKVESMKVIEETERSRRGFYCGSIGYIGFNGDFDLNIAIRTFTEARGRLIFNLGGGIVHESDPESEYVETMHKGKSMFESIRESAG